MILVMIVGEVDLVRGALAAVLAHEEDLRIVSNLSLQDDVVGAARAHRPAVVVLDLHLERLGPDDLAVAQQLTEELPECRVLLLSNPRVAPVLRNALAAGIWGLLSPDTSPERLVQSIRQVASGERVFDPELAVAALQPAEDRLTAKERAVLSLAGEGLRSQEIAERLFLSPGTVRNYLSTAKRKTGARNRLEAFRRAQAEGWL